MVKNDRRVFFTIVIPTLNEEASLPHLLSDLNNQTLKDFDIIVVDAKSTDETQSIARKYKANVVISNVKGVSYQRNLGAKLSKTDWIVFMDADNRLPKNYLSKIKQCLANDDVDILSTWIEPDTRLRKDKIMAAIMNIFMEINKNTKNPYILESMIVAKRKSFETLNGFSVNIPWREGEDLLKRALKLNMKFNFVKSPKYKYSFRRFRKYGAFRMLQEMSQMEIIKMLKGGELGQTEAEKLYPMKGGSFYGTTENHKMKLHEFISILFRDKTIDNKSLKSFKKDINTWKSLFR